MNHTKQLYFYLLILLLNIATHNGYAQCKGCELTYNEALAYNQIVDKIEMVEIPMRDGVDLNGRIYFPKDIPRENLPTVLIRSPYFIPNSEFRWFANEIAIFLRNGYVVMLNNERGRYWSEGDYTFLAGAKKDGYDVIEWIVNQPWSNGKVGTWGCSSSAEHQLGLSTMDHPGHAAMIPICAGAGIGEFGEYSPQGMLYRGGVVQMPWVRWYYQYGFNEFPVFKGDLSREDRLRLSKFYPLWAEKPDVNWAKALRHLPLVDQVDELGGLKSDYKQFIQQLPNDPRWKKTEFATERDSFGVPALHIDAFYDISFGPSSIELYHYMQSNAYDKETADNQFLIISATNHCQQTAENEHYFYGDRFLGDAWFDYYNLYVKWFDYWLKDVQNDVVDRPKVTVFTMGKNKWENYNEWPPEKAKELTFYLNSKSRANTKYGDGVLQKKSPEKNTFDEFIYDPENPVPSLGDNDWGMIPEMRSGSFDQSGIELREDVLVFSTPVLEKDIQVTGFAKVIIYLSSDVEDTDLTAKLVDVHPNGKAFNVAESIQRVRWRQGYTEPTFMKEGQVYKVEIGPLITSNAFKKGHRIRLEISSSNFPRFERNLNTGGNNYDETEWELATNRIHHGPNNPSRIILDVIDSQE
ncbi:CocE/NonD family hydrolase [Maribellus mangrovi]|uniref:CocE/NonD family hydrolase n=1 Tax=Maribellus mangrovi TaxID=3133146 RepID=UPI0030ED26F9